MPTNSDVEPADTTPRISRRTVVKGAAWSVPVIAVSAMAPVASAATSYLPCVGDIAATGGTYPVTVSLGGCSAAGGHWDFQFLITAAAKGTNCDCDYVRITFLDNPNRQSQLCLDTGDPQPQKYVQKVLAAGTSALFPAEGDQVKFVSNNNNSCQITEFGSTNDSLHTAYFAGGASIPCGGTGPMAYYKVECGASKNGPWTQLGDMGQIDPCIPMIASTVCNNGGGTYKLDVSVLQGCGLDGSDFKITSVRRGSNENDPSSGTVVWSTGTTLTGGSATITTSSSGSGSNLWIAFTTDNGANTSYIRVTTTNTACSGGGGSCVPTVSSKCWTRSGSSSNRQYTYHLGLQKPSGCADTVKVTKISTSAGSGGTTLWSNSNGVTLGSGVTTIDTTTPTSSEADNIYVHYTVGSGSDQSLQVSNISRCN